MYPNRSNFWGKLEPPIKICLIGPMETSLKPVPQNATPTEHPSFHILSYVSEQHGKNSHKSINKKLVLSYDNAKAKLEQDTIFFGGK